MRENRARKRSLARLSVILSTLWSVAACSGSPARDSPPADASLDTIVDTEETWFPDPVDRTAFRLRQLRRLVAEFEAERGHAAPDLLAVLPSGIDSAARSSALEDAWRNQFRYLVSDSTRELRSAGPDARFDTRDDLVLQWEADANRGR